MQNRNLKSKNYNKISALTDTPTRTVIGKNARETDKKNDSLVSPSVITV